MINQKFRWIWLLLPLWFSFAGCQQKEVEYYENGNKKTEFTKKGDEFDGESIWYYQNEQPKIIANYNAGKLHGPTYHFFYDGRKAQETHYHKGLKDGKALEWHDNGKEKQIANYRNDTLHGAYKEFFRENGAIKTEGTYHKGVRDSLWVWYYPNGLKASKADFDMGNGTRTYWFSDGKKESVITYQDNKKHGKAWYFNKKGDTIKLSVFEEDVLKDEQLLIDLDNL